MTRRRTIRTARDGSSSPTPAHPDPSAGTPAAASGDLTTRIAALEENLCRLKGEVGSRAVDGGSSRRDLFKKMVIAGAGVAVGTAGLATTASAAHQAVDLGLGTTDTIAGELHLLGPPVRAYDSREEGGQISGPLTGGQTRVVSLAGQFHQPLAVPYLATAALISLTLDRTVGNGYLSVVAEGTPSFGPGTSNINWYASGQTIAVTTVTTVKGAKVSVSAGGFGSTHFIIDVIGYYQ